MNAGSSQTATGPERAAMETSSGRRFLAVIAAWAAVIGLYAGLVQSTFLLMLVGYTSALALFALSINVMLGGIGEVPLGQGLFFGAGAYAIGICMKRLGLPYEVALLAGVASSILLALVLGFITLRLTGAYFSIVSWGIASVAVVVAINLEHVTGGGMGIFGLPQMRLLGLDLGEPRLYFLACSAVLLVAVVFLDAVRQSRFGAALESVRQNRHLASSLGVSVFGQRLKAFVLSAALAALAGGLTVPYTQIVTPESLAVGVTVDAMLMVLLGGTQWLFGPVVGAMVFSIIPFYLDMDANVRVLVFSVAIVLIMMFMPGGLYQVGRAAAARLKGARLART